jgi:hypothetical protein
MVASKKIRKTIINTAIILTLTIKNSSNDGKGCIENNMKNTSEGAICARVKTT